MGQRFLEETPKNKEVREGKCFWQEQCEGKLDTVSEPHWVLLQFKESSNVTSTGWDRSEEGRVLWEAQTREVVLYTGHWSVSLSDNEKRKRKQIVF